jgi:hypothetical protein
LIEVIRQPFSHRARSLGRDERVTDRERQLRVPADDVVALVRGTEDHVVAGHGLVAEQVDEVQRGLVGGLGPVLGVVGDVEDLPER